MSPSNSLLVLLAVVVPAAICIQCYDYTSTNNFKDNRKSWVDCPMETQFCYKSYLESRDFNNHKTYVEGRACGTPNLCVRDGCVGGSQDKACCCRKDRCNSASTATVFASLASLAAYFYVKQ